MSKNIHQVYVSNPSTTSSDDDLFYKGNTPYGLTDDSAIKWKDIIANIGALNLNFLLNRQTSFSNIGLGSGNDLTIDEGDFSGGLYTLTNPCPNFIFVNSEAPGNEIKLPPIDGSDGSFIQGQGPIFILQEGFETVEIQDNSGAPIESLGSPSCAQFVLTDSSDPDGVWYVRDFTSTVNGKSGDVVLTNAENNLYVDSNNGLDSIIEPGSGSILAPYKTIEFAMSHASPDSATNPIVIFCSGNFTETTVLLKPNVYLVGNGSGLSITNAVNLHSSWSLGGVGGIIGFYNVSLPAGMFLNFDASGSTFVSFILKDLVTNTSDTYNIIGKTGSDTQFIRIENFYGLQDDPEYVTLENMGGSVINCSFMNFEAKLTDSSRGDLNITNLNLSDDFNLTSNSNGGFLDVEMNGCVIDGNANFITTGTSEIFTISKANYYENVPVVSGVGTFFKIDVLQQTIIPLIGATLTYDSLGNGVIANFIPSNYTPVDPSVTGHLIGINNAIGGGGGGDLQAAYSNGSDAEVILSANRPVSFVNPVFTGGDNSVVTPSTGSEFTVNYANYGFTFTPDDDITVVSFQYNDNLFTQPGTRPAGIFVKSTQLLLRSDVISKTDPLDSSTIYRTKTLSAPLTLTGGVEYVYDVVAPPNEIHHTNGDAVPASGITITEARTSLGTHDPQPLQFPTFDIVVNNRVYAGSFQFNLGVAQESIDINDTLSGGSALASSSSTTRGTALEPSMQTSQKNAISTPIENLRVYDNEIKSPFFHNGTNWIKLATNISTRVVYLNSYIGNDAIAAENSGSIGCPFLTYAAATSYIQGLSPTNTNRFTILATGIFFEALLLTPHVDIVGNGSLCTFGGNFDFTSDFLWNSVSGTASTLVKNVNIFVTDLQFIEIDNGSVTDATFTFDNVNFNFPSGDIEFFNDRDNPNIRANLYNITSNQTLTFLDFQSTIINGIDISVSLFTSNISTEQDCFIQNVNGLTVSMANVASGNTFCTTSGCFTNSFSIGSNKAFWTMDITSYIDPVLTGGATLFNTEVLTSGGGIGCSTYSPSNFTPVAGTTYYAASLLGYIRGIDNALGAFDNSYGEMYVSGNTRGTTFSSAAFVKVEAGNPVGGGPDYSGYVTGNVSHFTFSNGRLTYTGAITTQFSVQANCTLVLPTGVSVLFYLRIAVNGSSVLKSQNGLVLNFTVSGNEQPVSTGCLVNLSTNDYVELFASNSANTGDKFILESLNFVIS